jgi:peptide/nickel transport system substrate-binding protein
VDRNDYQNNPDLPTMSPWMLVTKGSGASQLIFERNPYYWAVDTEGNQLPYIDTCILNIVESVDITKMKAISGELEVAVAAVMENFADYPLYAENATAGEYTVNTAEFDEPGAMNIHINMTHKDPAKRAVMETLEFRKAMSFAIDRKEIISVNYSVGPYASVIRQFSPYPGSPFFDEALSTQFTEFDPDQANQLLDGLGMDKRNADKLRLLPDGSLFTLVIDVPTYSDQWIDIGTMIAEDWKAVGINASARTVDPALWGQRRLANDYDVTIMTGVVVSLP